jgi:hypothetical protein
MQILKANIGLQKIEGARIAKDKTGVDCVIIPVNAANVFVSDKGGIYLNVDIIENKQGEDQYGNTHMITLDIGKDRRAAGEKGAILGNCKTLNFNNRNQPQSAANNRNQPQQKPQDDDNMDDVPF